MANPQLKRHQAVVWLPPRQAGERAFGSEAQLVVQTGGSGATLRRASLDSLEDIRQAWLIVDARDVTLLEITVPPLSGARLRQALPNLVEDYLLQDAARCLIVAGPVLPSGKRQVAVADREWVDFVVGAIQRRQIRIEGIWPAQLAIPAETGRWSIACVHDGVAMRTVEGHAIGWGAGVQDDTRRAAVVSLLEAAGVRQNPPERLDAWLEDASWQGPVAQAGRDCGVSVNLQALPVVRSCPVDLQSARDTGWKASLAQIDWRIWRTPALIALALVIVSLVGLNLHWGRLAREKAELTAAIRERYTSAFPRITTIVNPVVQMRNGLNELRSQSGRSSPADLVPLLARFGQALGPEAMDAVTGIEYRDGRMKLRFSPQKVGGSAVRERLKQSCARLGLKLEFDNERDPTATLSVVGA